MWLGPCLWIVLNVLHVAGLPERPSRKVGVWPHGHAVETPAYRPPSSSRALLRRDDAEAVGADGAPAAALAVHREYAATATAASQTARADCAQTDGITEFYSACACGSTNCSASDASSSFCYVDMDASISGLCLKRCEQGEVGPCSCGSGSTTDRAVCVSSSSWCKDNEGNGTSTCQSHSDLAACDASNTSAVPCRCSNSAGVQQVCTDSMPYCYVDSVSSKATCRALLALPHCDNNAVKTPCHCGTNESACTATLSLCYDDKCVDAHPSPSPTPVPTPVPPTEPPTVSPTLSPTVETPSPTADPTAAPITVSQTDDSGNGNGNR
eukprot:TRINITY_DN104666_c0_g1_i1.p1 TRINITY_DN104666_c0_g1~~TRINITY_DN104666_c0_g1_i1.p1  ORF type:complete len:325 (-),score=39.21 TRINITY_DN104666_c0_g1_i1:91-1065(-)